MKQSMSSIHEIVARLTRYFVEAGEQNERDHLADISMKQVYYIEMIERLGNPSFGELTKSLGLSKPSITAIVQKLIQGGYIRKDRSVEDKRIFHICLTEKGRQICKVHEEMHERIIQDFQKYLSGVEMEQLFAILGKITRGIEDNAGRDS
ncbi:MAG TPA: MarR family transcriptional regulator [Bacillota bacterium]